jgi:hypothetical protein
MILYGSSISHHGSSEYIVLPGVYSTLVDIQSILACIQIVSTRNKINHEKLIVNSYVKIYLDETHETVCDLEYTEYPVLQNHSKL